MKFSFKWWQIHTVREKAYASFLNDRGTIGNELLNYITLLLGKINLEHPTDNNFTKLNGKSHVNCAMETSTTLRKTGSIILRLFCKIIFIANLGRYLQVVSDGWKILFQIGRDSVFKTFKWLNVILKIKISQQMTSYSESMLNFPAKITFVLNASPKKNFQRRDKLFDHSFWRATHI